MFFWAIEAEWHAWGLGAAGGGTWQHPSGNGSKGLEQPLRLHHLNRH